MPPLTPLEKSLPIERLNPLALAEGNSKKPVYRMHKWWARRLGSVFRMITLAALCDGGEDDGADGEADGGAADRAADNGLWRSFLEGADLKGKIVLDPFMGGGTAVVEALRLGCRVIGVDINPVAWFITKKEAEPVEAARLEAAFATLERGAGARIRDYYRTRCPAGHGAEIMYVFWVKTLPCGGCGAQVRLFPNHELSRRDEGGLCVCPHCLELMESPEAQGECRCPGCGGAFDPRKGNSGRGKFRCLQCGAEERVLEAVRRLGGPPAELPHALEGWCGECGRFIKKMERADHALWRSAQAEFEERREELLIPPQAIPTGGRSDPRPVNHGYTHYHKMFNARQLLCLSLLLEEILALPDENSREFMLTAFSDCLDANTTFCKYEVAWHKISLFFGLHAYHPIERPTENNVWGTRLGRGTFIKCYRKVLRGKAFCENPWELTRGEGGQRLRHHSRGERIAGALVDDFAQLQRRERAALLRCQSAEKLDFLPDRSVDAVITDPPYFDNVQYAELADFFHVWLRLALRGRYPWFEPESTGQPGEIVVNGKLGKSAAFFNAGLGRVFAECRRVLKDEGLLVFTFHHNKCWAWDGLGKLLLEAGFYVSACPVVRSEGKSGYHSSEGNIKYDCVLVCRKAPTERAAPAGGAAAIGPEVEQAIMKDAAVWAARTRASGMTLSQADCFAIVMGQSLSHATKVMSGAATPARGKESGENGGDAGDLANLLNRMSLRSGEIMEGEVNGGETARPREKSESVI